MVLIILIEIYFLILMTMDSEDMIKSCSKEGSDWMSENLYSVLIELLTSGTHCQNIVSTVTLLTHLRGTFLLHWNRKRRE